ncbi:3-keto-5-aminohexanoate cleavage protein [Senegalia massiliensis]|uniref:3-keto-5-aminohexanoate cleavage protein n=1 Tax=Senegalia massiliensis TaxID=1720316 RepID=A0A845QVZ6_9CLOT|nr:3-keto-5-aminohexanoate cleavage protein [Senegalia massiliensis]NBI06174.1 3-keto-5-aminohexanoate cleavage protein [Senegalia massiliensis]
MSNQKTIITAAITGAVTRKELNENVPYTPEEIAEDVYKCYKAGAAIAHIHMRNDAGEGTMSADRFEKTVKLIKEKCNIIINLTTSGDLNATDETRQEHLIRLKPEMASFDAGSMNWQHKTVFLNTPEFLEKLGMTMQQNNVKPEIEVFDAGMIYNAQYYVKKGILNSPLHYQFVLGAAGGTTATVENLTYLKSLIPKDSTWSAFGIGKGHLPILLATIAMGGHVRVGLEDNIYYGKNVLATNEDLVCRAARIIKEAGNDVATPDEARKILGLK